MSSSTGRPLSGRNVKLFFLAEDPHTSNINAFAEGIAADSDKAFEMPMRRF